MIWSHPSALLALLAVPAAVALFAWAAARRREALAAFAGPEQARSAEGLARRRRRQAALVVLALGALALALAGPRYGLQQREARQEGLDLVIALDLSNSMRAEDVAPSRLERAKFEIGRLLEGLAGSRVGLVIFAGEAFLQCPLTTDFGALRLFLEAAEPDLIPTQGTDFAEMLRAALQALEPDEAEGEPRTRALLVVSDGEDHSEGFRSALASAREAGIALFAAGVGTPEGAPIPLRRGGRLVGHKTDRRGEVITTRLVEGSLRRLAEGGAYVRLGHEGGDLGDLSGALARLERSVLAAEALEAHAERFQWPLALALLLLAVRIAKDE